VVKVDENLYRGPRPKSFAELKNIGIKTVINLQSGAFEIFHNDEYEFEMGATYEINEVEIELSDFFPPTMGQWHEVLYTIKNSPGPVYIHCLHGMDRTGFICALYRMRMMAWKFEKARDEMYSLGFHKWPYLWWVFFLRKFELHHD